MRLFGNRDNNRCQYNLAGVLAAGEGHQRGLNDVAADARATTGCFVANALSARISRSPASPARSSAGLQHATARASEIEVDDNGFPVRPALIGDLRGARLRRRLSRLQWRRPFRPAQPDRLAPMARSAQDRNSVFTGQHGRHPRLLRRRRAELRLRLDPRPRLSGLYRERRRQSLRQCRARLRRDLREPDLRRRRHQLLDPPGDPVRRRRRAVRDQRPQRRARSTCARRRSRASRTSSIPGTMLLGVGADFDLTPQLRVSRQRSTICGSRTPRCCRRCATQGTHPATTSAGTCRRRLI